MQELLWLLLPLAAASGWYAARRSAAGPRDCRPGETSPAYFRGLNYLLNEQPDKAIDVFVQMLTVDSETFETHLALGSLFRRRGEVERAIRIHQNLIARPTLSPEERAQALLELGQDYMRAGLFDRAESLFAELRETKLFPEQALQNLRVIYQQEKDWERCLEVAEALEAATRESLGLERAHYYCEMAEQARAAQDISRAEALLKKAQSANRGLARVTWLQAEIEMARGDHRSAIRRFQRVAVQDPELFGEVLPQMAECYQRLDKRADLVAFLQRRLDARADSAVLLTLTDLVQQDEGDPAALRYIAGHLGPRPSLAGLLRMIRLAEASPQATTPELLPILRTVAERLVEGRHAYQCTKCGFAAKTLHWQCPGCRSWSSIKPVRDRDG